MSDVGRDADGYAPWDRHGKALRVGDPIVRPREPLLLRIVNWLLRPFRRHLSWWPVETWTVPDYAPSWGEIANEATADIDRQLAPNEDKRVTLNAIIEKITPGDDLLLDGADGEKATAPHPLGFEAREAADLARLRSLQASTEQWLAQRSAAASRLETVLAELRLRPDSEPVTRAEFLQCAELLLQAR